MEDSVLSLFELEKININTLLEKYPESWGINDFQTRANIALILKGEGRLKDCPLFSKDAELFFKLLSSTSNEIIEMYKNYKIYFPEIMIEYNNHRILCIYSIYSMIIRLNNDVEIQKKMLFEYVPYLDESYYQAIKDISDKDLYVLINIKNLSTIPEWVTHIYKKERASRIYNNVTKEFIGNNKKLILSDIVYLRVLASERKDVEKIQIIDNYTLNICRNLNLMNIYYNLLYLTCPNIETAQKCYNFGTLMNKEMIFAALSSVSGTSPYSNISDEIFTEIMEYITELPEMSRKMTCRIMLENAETENVKNHILMVRSKLCGENI